MATPQTARRLGLPGLIGIVATASSVEANLLKSTDICLGEGLGQAFEVVAQALGQGHAATRVICDMNGERYRANEYGMAALRVPRLFHNAAAFDTPADCWGDVGAASGPLHLCLAIEAEARGYATGPLTLVWGSSESGQRSAALLAQVRRADVIAYPGERPWADLQEHDGHLDGHHPRRVQDAQPGGPIPIPYPTSQSNPR